MKKPQEIFIVRHGQTDYNLKRIIQGRGVDSHLNNTGRQQALALFENYRHHDFDAVFASALIRTHQTVMPFESLGHTIGKHAHLDEIGWGDQEGKRPTRAMNTRYKKMIAAWENGQLDHKTETGESPLEVQARLSAFLEKMYEQGHDKVLICTHGRTARVLICTLLGISLTNMQHYPHKNTGVTHLTLHQNKYELQGLNCLKHLEDDNC